MIETRDGNSLKIRNTSFFEPAYYVSKWENKLEFGYGANNRLYARGKPLVKDAEELDAILQNNFIDVKNIAYDFDVTSEFTWDYRELVEIKKKKRTVNRFYTPTAKNLTSQINANNW